MQNFVYLIADGKMKKAAVVDAGWDAGRILAVCRESRLRLTKIILTHSHFDHVQAAAELASGTGAEILYHELDAEEIRKVIGGKIRQVKLKDGDEIKIGGIKVKVIHTPGHTQGSICLLVDDKLIAGDTLFVGAIGRTDLPGGDTFRLFDSLEKLKKLQDNVEIYPGHNYGQIPSSTIGNEKKYNPYFMCRTKQQFLLLVGFH